MLIRKIGGRVGGVILPEGASLIADLDEGSTGPFAVASKALNFGTITSAASAPAGSSGAVNLATGAYLILGQVSGLGSGDLSVQFDALLVATTGWDYFGVTIKGATTNFQILFDNGPPVTVYLQAGDSNGNRIAGTGAAAGSSIAWRTYEVRRVSGDWSLYEDGVQLGSSWTETGQTWDDVLTVRVGSNGTQNKGNINIANVSITSL
jgi:hypothetical protein